jgi:hypothetical protein
VPDRVNGPGIAVPRRAREEAGLDVEAEELLRLVWTRNLQRGSFLDELLCEGLPRIRVVYGAAWPVR